MPLKSVVLLSGGSDSLYAVLRELRETENEVHLHHHAYQCGKSPHQHDRNERIIKTSHSRLNEVIIPWLRANEREFNFTQSSSDFSGLPPDIYTVGNKNHCCYIGGHVCATIGASRLVTGHQMKRDDNPGPMGVPRMLALFSNSFGHMAAPIPPDLEWYFPCWNYDTNKSRGKKEVCAYLGDLIHMTSSCLNPRQADDGVWEQCRNRWPLDNSFKGKTSETHCWQCKDVFDTTGFHPDLRKATL